MTTNFIGTLLTNSPTYTVTSGFSTLLYDAYGAQTVSVSSGGSLSLVGAMGANNIRLHGNADAWQVMRSGSTTIFIHHTNGDRVEIPAIVEQQTISFADQSAVLRIETSGNVPVVKLGTQAIGTTASTITAWGDNSGNPNESSELVPWTLVMKHGATTFVSDGSAIGTHDTDIPQGNYSGYVTTPDSTKALAYGSGQGIWTVASSENSTQLSQIDYTTSYLAYSTYVTRVEEKVAFFTSAGGTALVTDGVTTQVSNLDFGPYYNAIYTESGEIWTPVYSQPYGSELGQIVLTNSGLESRFVKDIYPGGEDSLGYITGAALPDGRLVFSANDGSGYEPWVSDGTELGTFRLADFSRYSYGSEPSQFVKFNDQVAFTANLFGNSGDLGGVLVLTDGTAEGTTWVDPIAGGSDYSSILGIVNDQIYLSVYQNGTSKLYVTDGINATYLATMTGSARLIAWTEQIAYFSASDSAHGAELWALPLNGSGTLSLVKDILVGTGSALPEYNMSSFLVGDKLAFTAYSTALRESFYLSDGTSAGTVQLSTHAPSPLDYKIVGTALYFSDTSGTYYVDTALATPSSVRIGATSNYLQSDGDQVYFLANNALYVSDASNGAVVTLAENVEKAKVFQDNALYFIQEGSGGVLSLWYSDGTVAGTHFIEDLPSNTIADYDLANAVAIRTAGTTAPADTIAPVLRSAIVAGDQLVLTYADMSGLDEANLPVAAAFALTGTSAIITDVAVDAAAKTVTLTLSEAVSSSDQIRLSYTDPGADAASAIQDSAGNHAASVTNRVVSNRTPDDVAPTILSAAVDGATLVVQLADDHALDATNLPAVSAFSLGGTAATVESMVVDSSSKTLTLTLSQAVLTGEEVTLNYEDPTEANDTNALQDSLGNDLASFTGLAVQNNSQAQASWTLLMGAAGDNGLSRGFYKSDATESGSGLLVTAQDHWYLSYSTLMANEEGTKAILAYKSDYYGSWKVYGSNGTIDQTALLASNVSYNSQIETLDGLFVFNGANGLITDGTEAGTVAVSNLSVGQIDTAHQVIWSTNYTAPYGDELYKTDIATGSVTSVLVKDIYPGSGSGTPQYYFNNAVVLGNGKLIFAANDGVHGSEPWVSDGTEAGTLMLSDLYSGDWGVPSQFTLFGHRVAFKALLDHPNGGSGYYGHELVLTDGTSAGTYWLDVYEGYSSSNPTILGVVNNLLYFTATDAAGLGIFSTGGTTFTRLASINSDATLLGWSDSQAFFRLSDVSHGDELWVADLADGSFELVKDIISGSGAALAATDTSNSEMLNGKLLFTAYATANNQGYFVSDGTADGTVQIGFSSPTDQVTLGNVVVLADTQGVRSANIAGAQPDVRSISSDLLKSGTDALQADSDQAFYLLASGQFLTGDGSSEGFLLADDVMKFKVVAENNIYFITQTSQATQLWFSDGTEAGTRYVNDLPSAAAYFDLDHAVAVRTVGVNDLPL